MNLDTKNLRNIFSTIGLSNPKGIDYKQRLGKHNQVYEYLTHLNKAMEKLSTKRELVLVDCACGRAYLSFVANYYFTHVKKRKIKFVCIDYNKSVIDSAIKTAKELGFDNMQFICSDIFQVKFDINPDIVYSLHACDTATDMTIAKGILEDAKYIFTVSCCQHTVKKQLKKHPLKSVTKHGIYKERLGDMIMDSMRSLMLESFGYKTRIFEYVAAKETPKNIMLRAQKGSGGNKNSHKAKDDYEALKKVFNLQPKLEDYLQITNDWNKVF